MGLWSRDNTAVPGCAGTPPSPPPWPYCPYGYFVAAQFAGGGISGDSQPATAQPLPVPVNFLIFAPPEGISLSLDQNPGIYDVNKHQPGSYLITGPRHTRGPATA